MKRRSFIGGTSAAIGAALLTKEAQAGAPPGPVQPPVNLAASPPSGFTPFSAPGKVVKVSKPGSLQPNQLFPKEADAKAMLEKALTELTGKSTLVEAVKMFVHPSDKVVVKPNGIALKNMSTNKEL